MPDEEQDALDALEKEASDFTKVCTGDTRGVIPPGTIN